eukprot:403353230
MKRCTLIKIKIKQLLKNIDNDKSDYVLLQLFNDILKLHNVELRESDKNRLKQKYVKSISGQDKILYKEAIAALHIDLSQVNSLQQNSGFKPQWILRNINQNDLRNQSTDEAKSIQRFINSEYSPSIANQLDNLSLFSGFSGLRSVKLSERMKGSAEQKSQNDGMEIEVLNPELHSIKKIIPGKLQTPSHLSNMKSISLENSSKGFQNGYLKVGDYSTVQNKNQQIMIFNQKISYLYENDPNRYQKITDLNKLFLNKEISIDEFKIMLSFSLNLPQSKSQIIDDLVEAIHLINQETLTVQPFFTKQLIDDFFNLCHYWPLQIKRDSNQSSNMYKVLNSSKAKDFNTSLDFHKTHNSIIKSDIFKLYEMIWSKICEKFDKINLAYKFFIGVTTNKIAFNDFVNWLRKFETQAHNKRDK